MSQKPKLLVITNLYPVPWNLHRATFNRQQFAGLFGDFHVSILIPVSFIEWFRNRRFIKQHEGQRIVPYFYIPKLGRRFYSHAMFISLIFHSGVWISRLRPDIMMATWAFPDSVAASKIARLLKVPFVFKTHGSDINLHAKFKTRARQIRDAAKMSDRVISVSEDLASRLRQIGVPPKKISVLYNGVDHQIFGESHPSPHDRPFVLFVGNLIREKGVFELLDAFSAVAASYPTMDLIFVGAGPVGSALRNKANDLEISERVYFKGQITHSELPAWMTNCEFLALPSYREGVPNVLLEAMACGVPVLASRVGGIPEVIDSPDLGILIPSKDAEAIVNAFTRMLEGNWDRMKIMQHASRFSWSENQKKLIEILRSSLLATKPE